MTDLKTLALQSDPIQGEIIEILSPELRVHVQKLIDAAVMKERARCDRLREALKSMLAIHTESAGFNGQYGKKLTEFIEAQSVKVDAAIAKARQALKEAR